MVDVPLGSASRNPYRCGRHQECLAWEEGVPCKAWFFIYISWGELHINSWHWVLPPGIYGPGPPPIGLIKWPPGINIKGNLPNWPKITIGRDNQITTEEEGECETQTAEACTTTTYVSADSTLSSASMSETISGCSISVSDSSTTVIGTQTPAPIGTWHDEVWATMTVGDAYSNSLYDAPSAEMARDEASGEGTTISFTSGPTAGPTCAGATTACGGTLCSGYWCTPSPTGYPPGYQDPEDPSSGGYSAPTTTIGGSTTTTKPPTGTCTATNVYNCNESGCDACSPDCCGNGTCGSDVCTITGECNCNESGCDACSPDCCANCTCGGTSVPPPTTTAVDPCADFDCRACGTPFDDACCQSHCTG